MTDKNVTSAIIGKIILYCREQNATKLLKYLAQAQKLCLTSTNRNERFEIILRKKGALQALQLNIRKLVDSYAVFKASANANHAVLNVFDTKVNCDIFNSSLALLGNAFALDSKARTEASVSGFIRTLEKLFPIISLKTATDIQILKRVIKCLANLCNDSSCLRVVLRSKMETPEALLDIIDNIHVKLTSSPTLGLDSDKRLMGTEISQLLTSTVRGIRIISSSNDVHSYRITFQKRCMATFGNMLTWKFELPLEVRLDLFKILTSLTDKSKSVLDEIFFTPLVTTNPENIIPAQIVKNFTDSLHNQKLFSAIIRCLQNFSSDTIAASKLGFHGLLDEILDALNNIYDKSMMGSLIKLLYSFVAKNSENQYQLSKSSKLVSTLEILRNQEFHQYHCIILAIYDSMYEQSLLSLLSLGLIDILNKILFDEGGAMDNDILSKRITSHDSEDCSVHTNEGCPFVPKFRCSSPSYQQVQQEVEDYMKARGSLVEPEDRDGSISSKSDPWSLPYTQSPPCSPSWSSSSGYSSPRSDNETNLFEASLLLNRSASSSPVSCALSDDEGNYSISTVEGKIDLTEFDDEELTEGPSPKRYKLEHRSTRSSISTTNNSYEKEDKPQQKSIGELKSSAKKIVSILGILHKCTLMKTFPVELIKVTPTLLSIILSAKISIGLVKSGKADCGETQFWDSECKSMGQRSFELSFKILKAMFLNITTFHCIVNSGSISLLYRMSNLPKLFESAAVEEDSKYCAIESDFHEYCDLLMKYLTGVDNDTAGWREGFLVRQLLISKSEVEKANIALSIPLMYRLDNQSFKNFQSQGKILDKIFELLVKQDEISFIELQRCILALSSLCKTLGMKWTENDVRSDEPLLQRGEIRNEVDEGELMDPEDLVLFALDDGSKISANKHMLTNASPVFGAMFNGYFIETGQKRVQLRNVSKCAVQALLEQIKVIQQEENNITDAEGEMERSKIISTAQVENSSRDNFYELSTLFELLSLSDQYLLECLNKRALNTLLRLYICPNSAPTIYTQAVKTSSLWKPEERDNTGNMHLSYLILKYLLVSENISVTAQCGAFWKIFDAVSHAIVVSDLRALIEFHAYNKNLIVCSNSRWGKR